MNDITLYHLNAAVLVLFGRFFGELLDYRQSGLFVIVSLNLDILTFFICLNKINAMSWSVLGFRFWEFLYDGQSSFLIVVCFDFNVFALDHLDIVVWLLIILLFGEVLNDGQSCRLAFLVAIMTRFACLDGSVAFRNIGCRVILL